VSGRVVAGLPHPRAAWPAELSRWATSGTASVEFITCLTANEVRALIASGRHVDAVLLDGASAQVDADLVAVVESSGCTPVGIQAESTPIDWEGLGVRALLAGTFTWPELSDLLAANCAPPRPGEGSRVQIEGAAPPGGFLVGVCGAGGTGASTIAMALAQAAAGRDGPATLLADGARRADQALYNDTGDVVPGLPELLDRVRAGNADPDEIDDSVFRTTRGYDLLLGQRSAGDWVLLDRSSVAGVLEATLRRWQLVVVDHDGDLEDAEWTRSESIGARNAVSLELAHTADLWVVVAGPGTKGVASAARSVDEAVRAGVDQERIQVVFNRISRTPATRSSHAAALAAATAARTGLLLPPAFVGEVRHLEAAHRDAMPLPRRLVEPVGAAFDRARGSVISAAPPASEDRTPAPRGGRPVASSAGSGR
jgi:MinD-like ATPase involved in chromosome partitioning or flagellar assembly